MAQQLRATTINLKSFDQDIPDPIVAGGGDADGRTFRVVFDQEAAAQLTDASKLYLSWSHQQNKVRGYNVFDKVQDENPQTWEITWPQKMLREGDVLCAIELVDEVSIVQSQNFTVHVLSDPNDGSEFVLSDDFSVFQTAVVNMNSLVEKVDDYLAEHKAELDAVRGEADALKEELAVLKAQIEGDEATTAELVDRVDGLASAVSGKLDTSRVGFEFDEETQTIKDYVDRRSQPLA